MRASSFPRCLLLLAALALLASGADAQDMRAAKRYEFKIDTKASIKDLLPPPPDASPVWFPWEIDVLEKTTEILFDKSAVVPKGDLSDEESEEALKEVAHTIAKVNHLNKGKVDAFIEELRRHRPDLVGLPWIEGEACRMTKENGAVFSKIAMAARGRRRGAGPSWPEGKLSPTERLAWVAFIRQTMPMEPASVQSDYTRLLSEFDGPEATRQLARLAVFSTEQEIRAAATKLLRSRPGKDYAEVLLAGLRYPWPGINVTASHALMHLGRSDLLPQLADMLDEPDPRAPFWKEVDGEPVAFVREVVRLNHNRNCLLCHAPANTPDVELGKDGWPSIASGPVPSQVLPLPAAYYRSTPSPDILVRADVTYLRQDFSINLKLKDASPWPASQRFDFLVRERRLAPHEATHYLAWRARQGDAPSAFHQAVLTTLRGLSGREAPAPTAAAWRLEVAR